MAATRQPLEQREAGGFKKTIIIVEDDPANAEVLALLLKLESPYQTICFRSGVEILDCLPDINALTPVLFLLDYRLPRMNAVDLYHRLHTTAGLEKVPALILSGSAMSEEEKENVAQQGLLLIWKPYDIDDLLATILQVVA